MDSAALYPFIFENARAMVFVDGENLAIRYSASVKANGKPSTEHVWHLPSVAVWSAVLSPSSMVLPGTRVIRKHYYTSVRGDDRAVQSAADWLKDRNFEAPRVFKRNKSKNSKRVDISLSTDMLTHAFRRHYEIAVLVAGDEDYVPLVQAVKAEGARVHVWFLSNGLSARLRHESDHFVNLDEYLL